MVNLSVDTKDKCVLNIEVDPPSRPFYTSGDIVSGYVRVIVLSKIAVAEIKVVLQCEEKASVAIYKKDKDAKKKGRKTRAQEKTRHFVSVQHPLYTEKRERHISLEKGEYIYPFQFDLPDSINSYPPHALIYQSKNLYAGVQWSIDVTLHRPKLTQSAFTSKISIPVQPWPHYLDVASTQDDQQGDAVAGGFSIVQEKPGFLDLLKGQRASANVFEAQFTYPLKGIPQNPHRPSFGLKLNCEQLTVQIGSIEVIMVQKCKAKAKGLQDTFVKEFSLGVVKMSQPISSQATDVSDLLDNKFMLPEILVAPFTSTLLSVSYELRLIISFVPLIANGKPKPQSLVVDTPVNLQSPLEDWAQERVQSLRPLPGPPPRHVFPESSSGYASGPRSITQGTAYTDATGTGTASSYLSYEIQRPGHVMSNVMQWLGKSNNEGE